MTGEKYWQEKVNVSKEMVLKGVEKGWFTVDLKCGVQLIFYVKNGENVSINEGEIEYFSFVNEEFDINQMKQAITEESIQGKQPVKQQKSFAFLYEKYFSEIELRKQEELERERQEKAEIERKAFEEQLRAQVEEEERMKKEREEQLKEERLRREKEKEQEEAEKLKRQTTLEIDAQQNLSKFNPSELKSVRVALKYQQQAEDELKVKIIQFEAKRRAEEEHRKELERQRYELKKQQNLKFQQQKQIFQVVHNSNVTVDYQDENEESSEKIDENLRYQRLPRKPKTPPKPLPVAEIQPIFMMKTEVKPIPKPICNIMLNPKLTQKHIKLLTEVTMTSAKDEFKYLHEAKSENFEREEGGEERDVEGRTNSAQIVLVKGQQGQELYYNCRSPIKVVKQSKMMKSLQSSPLMKKIGKIRK